MLLDADAFINDLRECHVSGYIIRVAHFGVRSQVMLDSLKLFALPTHNPAEERGVSQTAAGILWDYPPFGHRWLERKSVKHLVWDKPIRCSLPEVLSCNSEKLSLWPMMAALKLKAHAELSLDGGGDGRQRPRPCKPMFWRSIWWPGVIRGSLSVKWNRKAEETCGNEQWKWLCGPPEGKRVSITDLPVWL